jgi:hypothetical protein
MKPSRIFEAQVDVLPPAQRRLWSELKDTPPQFTLYGGTALALRLAHRQSADFDFFSNKPLSGERLLERVSHLHRAQIRQLEPNTLVATVRRSGEVQLSFFGGLSIGQIEPAERAAGPLIKVATLRDIAGTKLSVVMQRAEPKDYIDIHALLTQARIPLAEMLACARAIFGRRFEPLLSMKALAYHDDPALRKLSRGIRKDLTAAIRATDPSRLPSIKAVKRRNEKP